MKRALLPVGVTLAMLGCTHVSETRLPDGRVGYTISCGGDGSRCLNAAAEQCHGAYRVLAGGTKTGTYSSMTAVPMAGGGMTASGSTVPVSRNQIIIECP